MTNDAERVSDIVARLRTDAPELVRHAAYQRRVHGTCPPGDNIFEDAAAHSIAAADIIEAQSKALAEASKQLALTGTDALSSGSANREDAGLVASRGFADALIEISLIKIDLSEATDPIALFNHLNRAVKIARAALIPTPENPNG